MMGKAAFLLFIILLTMTGGVFYYSHRDHYDVIVQAPDLRPVPDIQSITGRLKIDVRSLVPPQSKGTVKIREMRESRYFDYMAMNSLMSLHSALQGRENPVSLEIEKGTYRLEDLEDGERILKTGQGWEIHVPVIVHPQASLVIDTGEVPVILSGKAGSFLSNFGTLFIIDSRIETDQGDGNSKKFRPYIVVWSGGKGYFSGSRLHNLGYDHAKSYGITFSSSAIMEREEGKVPPPWGMLVDNYIEGLHYGFYCYEAADIVIARNIYRNNRIYGIDPHDYSKRLLIAFNDVSGSTKKHGIILSRSVTDSIVYGNKVHHNAGSGIMLERNSRKNLVLENTIENNGADGLVFLESPDNISIENIIRDNEKSGIRIRNSWNLYLTGETISKNGDYGVNAYKKSLTEQADRDLEKDAYRAKAGFVMSDSTIIGNRKAAFRTDSVNDIGLSDLVLLNSPKIAAGDIEQYAADLQTHATHNGEGLRFHRKKSYADFLSMR